MAAVSCGPTAGPAALRVRVLVDPGVAATCIVLQVNGGSGGEQRQVRGAGTVERDFTVDRGALPATAMVKAGAGVGDACADPLVFSEETQEVEGTFSTSLDAELVLHLSPPTPGADRDGDGFAASANGGTDCDDNDASVHPGAKEVCLAGVDADCDTQVGCADSDCSDAPCAPGGDRLAFASWPQSLAAGDCSAPVILRAVTSSGALAGIPQEVPLQLQLTPPGSLRFFVDPACTVPLDEVHLGPGTQPAQFHVKAVTGGTDALQASATGLQAATQSFAVRPMVMSGTCNFPIWATQVRCPTPYPYDPAHALLIFQAATNDNTPSNTNIACSITSGTDVLCGRDQYFKSTDISWRVLQRGELTVNHLQPSFPSSFSTITIPAVARMASTFLLTSTITSGSTNGDNDFRFVQLTSPTTVQVAISGGGGGVTSVQVVEWPGSSVTRGVTPPMEFDAVDVTGLAPVDLTRTFLTYGWRSFSGGGICDRSIRGELISPTAIRFHRGDGNPACYGAMVDAIGWERVQLPPGVKVQPLEMSLAPLALTTTAGISAVDVTRSLLFAGGQFTDGQTGGEGSYAGDDVLGETSGAFTFDSSSQVRVTRAASQGSARWNAFAVEVPP